MPTGIYIRKKKRKLSVTACENIRKAQIKKWQNPEYREHMLIALKKSTNTGRFKKGHYSTCGFKKGNKGYWKGKKRPPFSKEWKDKIGIGGKGRIVAAETRKKIGEKRKAYCELNPSPRGEKNPNWKGGRLNFNGYILVYKPNRPYANCSQHGVYVFEHRFVVEAQIGRYLTSKETVHHLGEKDDNRPHMLMAFTNKIYHLWFHKKGSCNPKGIIFDGRKLLT